MKILAIDDNRDNLTTLKAILRDAFSEAEVLTALDGPKGIDLALSEDPDVILLDIVMPGMDGFEVCRRLKQDDAVRHIPVVFLTALKTDRESRIRALDIGAEAFLAKPIDEVELIAQVRAMRKIKEAHVREQTEKERLATLVRARTQQLVKELKERMEAEKALRKSEEELRLTLRATTDGIWKWNFTTNELSFSERYYTMLGYQPDEFPPSFDSWKNLIHPDDLPYALSAAEEYLKAKPDEYENSFRLRTKDGSYRWTRTKARVVERNEAGDAVLMIGNHEDITERKEAEEALRASEEEMRALMNATTDAAFMVDLTGKILTVNREMAHRFNASIYDMMGTCIYDILPAEVAEKRKTVVEAVSRTGKMVRFEDERNGQIIHNSVHPVLDADGTVFKVAVFARDITEQKQAEEEREKLQAQLLQAQKMESVGRLAGGVAHDFNNMLQSILGHADLALMKMDKDHTLYADLKEIRNAANRSTNIIRQLLAFARKQIIEPKVLNLNDQVAKTLKMLRRLTGEDMDLTWKPGADLWDVKMDPAQIDQILVNLVVNARDAIVDVGQVVIESENAVLDQAYCATHPGSVPGPYVRVTVRDTGCGMDKKTVENIFDPFFTTKEAGKGTGLGLATVYGIVKQNNGYIAVHSEPGEGTSFDVYLPRHEGESDEAEAGPAVSAGPAGGTETVLIVEDNPIVLEMGSRLLSRLRYTVLNANSPEEAVRLAAEFQGPIHLLITDVVMPGMNGRDLADRLCQSRPEMKCLYMSGYTADIIARQGVLEEGVQFIQKPFSLDQLARKVREAMGSENGTTDEHRFGKPPNDH